MTLTALLTFAGTLAVISAMPGPSVAALVARVLARGAGEVLPLLAAMWLGDAIWLGFAVWGLSAIAERFEMAFAVLRWIGVAYLLYLAWKMWRAPSAFGTNDLPERGGPWRMFGTGLAVTLGNPKIMMFYTALLPTIIDLTHVSVPGWAELTGLTVLTLMVVDLSWVFLATRARTLLRSPRAVRATNRVGAGVIVGAAVAIATT